MLKTKKLAQKQSKPIPASSQEWPNHDETWFEFMVRMDGDPEGNSSVAIIFWSILIACCVLAAFAQAVDPI